MYFLKTKGTEQIPDFIQIRDHNFALIYHLKLNKLESKLDELNLKTDKNEIIEKLNKKDYGILQQFE